MEYRLLGRTNQSISFIGLGCVTFGREIDEEASYPVLDYAVEKGITWFDTAEAYGGGNAQAYRRQALNVDDVREATNIIGSAEIIMGRWLTSRGCRDKIILCSKVNSGNSPENIEKALKTSLDRLQVEYVDIYELHSPDDQTPIQESMAALAEQVESGRVRHIGCSNFSAVQLREALEVSKTENYPRFEVIQPPYSLAAPEAQDDLFPLCRSEEIGITTYSPLAAGFLAGKYTPDRDSFPKGSRFDVIPGHADIYFNERNFRNVERLQSKARELGMPMVRLAMAWAMTHPDITSVIVGARKTSHIDNALEAYDMKMEPALREELNTWLYDRVKRT